jgi:hypothetical protein
MAMTFEDLVALVMALPAEDRHKLARLLSGERSSIQQDAPSMVRDGESGKYEVARKETDAMTYVTVTLPEDLARQASEAGLLQGRAAEDVFRRALVECTAAISGVPVKHPVTFDMGRPLVDLTKALSLSIEIAMKRV